MARAVSRKVYLLRRPCDNALERTSARMPVQPTPTTPKRLRILGDEEIDTLYSRPRFTPDEQQEYFAFSPPELAALAQFHSRPSRLYSMLQLGYFKARQQFFVFSLREVDA